MQLEGKWDLGKNWVEIEDAKQQGWGKMVEHRVEEDYQLDKMADSEMGQSDFEAEQSDFEVGLVVEVLELAMKFGLAMEPQDAE